MFELLKEILLSPLGSFSSVLAFFLFAFWAAVKLGGIIQRFKIVDKIEANIESINQGLYKIEAFMEVSRKEKNPLAQSQSPIELTKKGEEISIDLNAKQKIHAVWERISSDVSSKLKVLKDENPYTIQEVCFEIGANYSSYFDKHDMDHIKTVAFKSGFSLAYFDLVFGIEIRNKYFAEKNIEVDEVDTHNPEK